LKQIFINLITNALKFTGAAGTVTIRGFVDKAGWMVIDVQDSGIGMTELEIDKALEPFGQVDSAINRRHPGTGLGLPLTKSMVELHGGRLSIESQVGKGTLVRALFPSERVVNDRSALNRADKRAVAAQSD
jgi:two-component system cell cycle sensor histidine kinase PleC